MMANQREISRRADPARVFVCPECGNVATVMWATRPICVHAWEGNAGTPEIWDGDNVDGYDRKIEESPHEPMRVPGSDTCAQMLPWPSASNMHAKRKQRFTVGLIVAAILGGALGITHAPEWLAFVILSIFVFMVVPWVVEGVWVWQLRRSSK